MKQKAFISVFFAIAVFLGGCSIFAILGSGNIVSETRDLATINAIAIEGQGEVEASMGSVQSISITTDDNIINDIETIVENGTLKIRNRNYRYFAPTNGIRITVVMVHQPSDIVISGDGDFRWVDAAPVQAASLSLTISGSGRINLVHSGDSLTVLNSGSGVADINSNNVSSNFTISGSGSLSIRGSSTNASLVISGSGDYDAFEYTTVNTSVTISGTGSANVYASGTLDCVISGSGVVRYRGNPTLSLTGGGSSSVMPD